MSTSIQNALINQLDGFFTLKRKMDHPPLSIEGEAYFYLESNQCIVYYEQGLYVLNHIKHEFYQKRYFIFEKDTLKILTYQKTLLHEVCLSDLKPPCYHFSHIHFCHRDRYCFDFKINDKIINMKYQIYGPLKNYSIDTFLEKK
ncbi:MAG: hypothetical protein BGO07_04050 [Alphaproteobacteria bacterium 40-19]|nr:MAG: hypothetical protein BGO07_04050 [Alphaproteobacteria bacterium 40-19]